MKMRFGFGFGDGDGDGSWGLVMEFGDDVNDMVMRDCIDAA